MSDEELWDNVVYGGDVSSQEDGTNAGSFSRRKKRRLSRSKRQDVQDFAKDSSGNSSGTRRSTKRRNSNLSKASESKTRRKRSASTEGEPDRRGEEGQGKEAEKEYLWTPLHNSLNGKRESVSDHLHAQALQEENAGPTGRKTGNAGDGAYPPGGGLQGTSKNVSVANSFEPEDMGGRNGGILGGSSGSYGVGLGSTKRAQSTDSWSAEEDDDDEFFTANLLSSSRPSNSEGADGPPADAAGGSNRAANVGPPDEPALPGSQPEEGGRRKAAAHSERKANGHAKRRGGGAPVPSAHKTPRVRPVPSFLSSSSSAARSVTTASNPRTTGTSSRRKCRGSAWPVPGSSNRFTSERKGPRAKPMSSAKRGTGSKSARPKRSSSKPKYDFGADFDDDMIDSIDAMVKSRKREPKSRRPTPTMASQISQYPGSSKGSQNHLLNSPSQLLSQHLNTQALASRHAMQALRQGGGGEPAGSAAAPGSGPRSSKAKGGWMDDIDSDFGLAAANAGFSPKGSPLASRSLGQSPPRNEADPKDWMAKNRRKIQNGSFGPISKALGKLEDGASKRYMRLQVMDNGDGLGGTAGDRRIESRLMLGSSVDFEVVKSLKDGLFQTFVAEVKAVSVAKGTPASAGSTSSEPLDVGGVYEVVLKSRRVEEIGQLLNRQRFVMYEPWTVVRPPTTGAVPPHHGLIIGSDVIVKGTSSSS